MKEFNYIIKRILQMIPVLLVVTVVIFAGMRLIPGSPAITMLGDHATPQAVEEMNEKLGLNEPLIVQYFLFLRQVLTFDFGNSITLNAPVWDLFKEKAVVTLTYYFPDKRRRDSDNYAGKLILDGLVRAGIIEDDSFDNVQLVLRGGYDKENPRTEIEVEEIV